MDKPSKRKHSVAAGPSPQSAPASPDPDKRRKVIGPSFPPPTEPSKHSDKCEAHSDSDSSDDDDFGPSLPPPAGSAPAPQPIPQASISTTAEKHAAKSAPQRDSWMLAPPTGDSRSSRVDPTKLRNRKFQSGPRVGSATTGSGGVDSSWTETPEEKMRRLQNEAMGIVSSASTGGGGTTGVANEAEEKKAQAMREKVQRYNERVRKEDASVVEERKRKEKEEEDDPSKRAFDKEKDMALGGRISHAQRREMMSKAADFGSRFSKGKFL